MNGISAAMNDELPRFANVRCVFNDRDREQSPHSRNGRGLTSGTDLLTGQWARSLRFSVHFTMAGSESSTNNVVTMLENLLRILKEEHVFDRSDDQRVVQFEHPEVLQVNISFISHVKTLLLHIRCYIWIFCQSFLYLLPREMYFTS